MTKEYQGYNLIIKTIKPGKDQWVQDLVILLTNQNNREQQGTVFTILCFLYKVKAPKMVVYHKFILFFFINYPREEDTKIFYTAYFFGCNFLRS